MESVETEARLDVIRVLVVVKELSIIVVRLEYEVADSDEVNVDGVDKVVVREDFDEERPSDAVLVKVELELTVLLVTLCGVVDMSEDPALEVVVLYIGLGPVVDLDKDRLLVVLPETLD